MEDYSGFVATPTAVVKAFFLILTTPFPPSPLRFFPDAVDKTLNLA